MKTATLNQVANYCEKIRRALDKVSEHLGPIQIGNIRQFPNGWGKARKGRTVWRIVEEAINQNLKAKCTTLGLDKVCPPDRETSIFDVELCFKGDPQLIHLNFKAAVADKKHNKGDISKAKKVLEFFAEDLSRQLFIVTFPIAFGNNMTIKIENCLVTPITWLPDIYVNPSNNGNLQCRHPENLKLANRRTNARFVAELKQAMPAAAKKRQ
jgi:hypothetical protein